MVIIGDPFRQRQEFGVDDRRLIIYDRNDILDPLDFRPVDKTGYVTYEPPGAERDPGPLADLDFVLKRGGDTVVERFPYRQAYRYLSESIFIIFLRSSHTSFFAEGFLKR